MRKILGMLITLSLLLGMIPMQSHAASGMYLDEVTALGIIKAEDSGFDMEQPVPRDMFAAFMVRLYNMEDMTKMIDGQGFFQDVGADAQYAKYIAVAREYGFMLGTAETTFSPEQNIRFTDAVKTIITMMGYQQMAETQGGYPEGYLNAAMQMQLLKGVQTQDPMLGSDVVRLIYNALDVALPVIGNGIYDMGEQTPTLRKKLQYQEEVYKRKGIVTANSDVWTIASRPMMLDAQIEIDGELYNLDSALDAVKIAGYLGMEVNFYAKEIANEDYLTIVSISPSNKNNTLRIAADDIEKVSDNQIWYEQDGQQKNKKAVLSEKMLVVKNGRLLSAYNSDTFAVRNGYMDLVDNDNDGKYDYVFLYAFTDVVLERVTESTVYFRQGFNFDNKQSLTFDLENTEKKYRLTDAEGNSRTLADLAAGQVLSIGVSEDGEYYDIRMSEKTAEGRVTGKTEEEYKIDSTYYDVSADFQADIDANGSDRMVGNDVKAYLNIHGKIVDMELVSSYTNYGYIAETRFSDDNDGIILKLIAAGDIQNEIEVDDSSEDNVVENPVLKCQNSDYITVVCGEEIKIGGMRYDFQELAAYLDMDSLNRFVSYSLNENGTLKSMKNLKRYGKGTRKYYNAYEKIFGKMEDRTPFAIEDGTKAICIPENIATSRDDYFVQIELTDGNPYNVIAFEVNEQSYMSKLIAITEVMSADSTMPEKKTAIVTAAVNTLNEFDEVTTEIQYFLDGEAGSAVLDEEAVLIENGVATDNFSLGRGDIIKFDKNSFGQIIRIQRIAQTSDKSAEYNTKKTINSTTYDLIFGKVENIKYNQISNQKNRWVTSVSVSSADRNIEINNRNTPVIYILDRNECRIGSIDDIDISTQSNPSRLFVFRESSTDKMECLVVVR